MRSGLPFTAIVLAGDRVPDDPVARAAGVPCKALVPVGGVPMVLRVLEALAEAQAIGDRIFCGLAWHAVEANDELHDLSASGGQVKWVEARTTPSFSVRAVMQSLPLEHPVLLVTADHALLHARRVDDFCSEARVRDADVVVGLAAYDLVAATLKNLAASYGFSRTRHSLIDIASRSTLSSGTVRLCSLPTVR